ncbi:hypothetical protein NC652_020550 [Populus alba x Populus x berolinensis]|nr:hypothetical protein NC652_020550 [Populus alba x Populus x berolinensis]
MEGAELELERRSKFLSGLIEKKKAKEHQEQPSKLSVRVRAADMPIVLQDRAFRCARDQLDSMPGKLDSKRLALALKKLGLDQLVLPRALLGFYYSLLLDCHSEWLLGIAKCICICAEGRALHVALASQMFYVSNENFVSCISWGYSCLYLFIHFPISFDEYPASVIHDSHLHMETLSLTLLHLVKQLIDLNIEFDAAYGPAWHCIVGTSFGSYVTHSTGGFLYFSIDKVYILLFRTAVEPLER